MKEYTLQQVRYLLQKKLSENHVAVFENWKDNKGDTSLEATMLDINTTSDMLESLFDDLIENES